MANDTALEVTPETSAAGTAPEATPATPSPRTFTEHYHVAKAAQSKDQAPSEAEGGTATPPAEDPPTEDQPKETVPPEDTLLTAEEVSKLNPKELSLYKKAQATFTQKTQKLAEERKQLEPWKEMIGALQDPARSKETIARLAEQVGLIQPKTEQAAVVLNSRVDKALSKLPQEYQFIADALRPVLGDLAEGMESDYKASLDPIAKTHKDIVSQSIANSTEATLEAFEAKHKGWQTHEPAMLEIMRKYTPDPSMTDIEFMEMAYKLATYGLQSEQQTKKIVDKMVSSAKAAETVTATASPDRVEIPLPPRGRRSLKDAFAAAKRGERWTEST